MSTELSPAKRALLERYLRRELPVAHVGAAQPEEPASQAHTRVPVVALQPNGSKRPFFYLHVHWQGGAAYCFTLAHKLGNEQPVYLLDPYRFEGLEAPPSIEAMATDYIASMRSVQPHGPYLLGGFCGASLIAHEMAQQLRAQGEEMALLVFVEPMAGPIRMSRFAGRLVRTLGERLGWSAGSQVDWFLRIRHLLKLIRRTNDEFTDGANRMMREWCQRQGRRFSLLPPAGALRLDWLAEFAYPVSGYVPRPYPGKVTYLLARDNPDGRRLWWGRPAPGPDVEIYSVPGDNATCRSQYAEELTDRLSWCIERAQRQLVATPAG
jgi:hypothetical protein